MAEELLKYTSILQVVLGVLALAAMYIRRAMPDFRALFALIGANAIVTALTVVLLFYRAALGIPIQIAYNSYAILFWINQILGLYLIVLIIYGIFTEAMRPFPGLQRIGRIVFRWVGVVSFLVAIALATGPGIFSRQTSTVLLIQELCSHLQQGINVLILCVLIFVCFAIRPLGLTFRSRLFGVVLGLGIFSAVQLVQAAWLATANAQSMYSPIYLVYMVGFCVSLCVWFTYFAMPEPQRKMILLPTTSPFFLWNRISEILGDAPGQVAVAGFTPSMLAAAEIEMLTVATSHEAAAERERERESTLLESSSLSESRSDITAAAHRPFALSQ